ncbi:hypothetical protein CSC94_16770 [Zhengella mangrovi]|uniref:Uncharacterized protein n=1 Tax=Zhengella mangrovi TaxID=1982044 RepID=A0A2G1QKE3_9HYPH|nr:hypothetical protein [Zhengella mangrovi]PHP65997.1 hypothetical protein CSC94_16770 [Zhengella mangrovi]
MKLVPGDIVEIETPGGPAHVQVIHDHPSYPEVVRVLTGLQTARPADLEALARQETRFIAMLPLGRALETGRVRGTRLGTAAIPAECKAFPTFRMPIRDRQGNVVYWWLWDGEGLSHAGDLTAEQALLPIREVMPAETFVARLAGGLDET